ncbi:MAG: methyltransferase domain-containing protein [Sedimentisphaerales bacterium]|nr:methyltransferase domain-containing protein [Sedimentisphaerales bacterium]
MEKEEIVDKINSFDRWHYEFDLNGCLTPIVTRNHINRHLQRKKYFFEPMVDFFGGALTGKRVLDLGCNSGYWSLQAINSGAEYVFGVDGRKMHIDQANFVFQVNGVDKTKYKFIQSNFFSDEVWSIGQFDIVFCFGILYHINKHFYLLEKIREVNSEFLLIDTQISLNLNSSLEFYKESVADARNSVEYELVGNPSHNLIFDMAEALGYNVISLEPDFTDYTGADDYKSGRRKAYMCSLLNDLSSPMYDNFFPNKVYRNVKTKETRFSLLNIFKKR